MLEALHSAGSAIRNSPLLKRQTWLWNTVEPAWQSVFQRLSRERGFLTQVNGDSFYLRYETGSRYSRSDQHVYEPDFYLPFVSEVREGMTVIDVGSHLGFFTLGAALRVGTGGTVVGFEPSPETFAILQEHIRLNRWEGRAQAFQGVVTDHDGSATFYTYGTSMAASISQENVEVLNPEQRDRPAKRIDVRAFSLDTFCQSRGLKPDIVKIDVEGAEVQVLRGAQNLLRNLPVIVFCEVHPPQLRNCGASIEEFHRLVQDLGLRSEPLDQPHPTGIYHCRMARA